MWPSSQISISTLVFGSSVIQVSFLVFLKSLSSGLSSPVRLSFPSLPSFLPVITILPHFKRVTFSPTSRSFASSFSTRRFLPYWTVLFPSSGFFYTKGWVSNVRPLGPLDSVSLQDVSFLIAVYLNTDGSMTSLLTAQILSHSISTVFFEAPFSSMNLVKAIGVIPCLIIP